MNTEQRTDEFFDLVKQVNQTDKDRMETIEGILKDLQNKTRDIQLDISRISKELPVSQIEKDNPNENYSSHIRLPNELRLAYTMAQNLEMDISRMEVKISNYRPVHLCWTDSDTDSFTRQYRAIMLAIKLSPLELDADDAAINQFVSGFKLVPVELKVA